MSAGAPRAGEPATLGEQLERAAEGDGGLRLLDRGLAERWLGWGELRRRALAVAAGLRALGVAPGDRVALVYPTGEDFFAAFFGVLAAGAVPAPLYPPVRLGKLDEYHRRTGGMLRASGARLVLAEARIVRLLGAAVALGRPALGVHRLDELPVGDPAAEPHAAEPGELALVQFSSGTTVDPKPVALSHRAVLAQTAVLNAQWPETGRAPTGMSWLPLYHDMGLIGCVFSALALGTELTLLPPEDFVVRPALWLQAISRHRATVSPAPNFAYALAVRRIRDDELDGVDLGCWRVALNGAETVAPEVLRAFCHRFERWGFRPEALTPVYGLAEAALAVTFSALDRPFVARSFDREELALAERALPAEEGVEIVSVGRPLPGFALEVRDERGAALPEGRVGRVWVRGPSLMEGYLDLPEESAAALVDGWLDTGDKGFVADGELFLSGRIKDMVLLRGRNYAPAEIEQALDPLPAVRTGCSVAASWLPEGADGERLVLLVEAHREATEAQLETLPEECRKAVLRAVGLSPEEVVVLPPGTLPRTSSGKLRRQHALDAWRRGELRPPRRVTAVGMALEVGKSAVAYARRGGRRRGG